MDDIQASFPFAVSSAHIAESSQRNLTTRKMQYANELSSSRLPASNLPMDVSTISMNAESWIEAELSALFSSGYQRKSFLPISIYKVPQKLQQNRDDSFVPRLVTIGPNHRSKPHLQAMEAFKLRCLGRFKRKYKDALTCIAKERAEKETEIRNYYEGPIEDIEKEEFIKMMTLDGIFILEFMSEISTGADQERRRSRTIIDEKIFDQKWMKNDILYDMLLMENQLPWFVISLCLRQANKRARRAAADQLPPAELCLDAFLNLLDAIILFFQGLGITCHPETILVQNTHNHFLEILWESLLSNTQPKRPRRRGKPDYTRTATELDEAGITFKNGWARHWRAATDIDFSFRDGTLTIPTLYVNEWTETLFRNLIALEQCKRSLKHRIITSYVIFMDYLIDTSADVDLLKKHGILDCSWGDSQQVADLFNNLHKETFLESQSFYFARQCEDLNEYRNDFLHGTKATLLKWKRVLLSDNYLGNPWAAIAVFASCVLLGATILQAV